MKNHPYNPVGARLGKCGMCGEHFTHEVHYIPITDVKAEEPPLKEPHPNFDPHPDFPNLDRTLMDRHSRRVAAALTKYQHHYDTTEEGYLLHGSGALACSMRALLGDQQEMARYRSERNAARAQLADFIAKVDVALGGEGTAPPERVLEKARAFAACAPSAMHAAVHDTEAPVVVHYNGLSPRYVSVERAPNGEVVSVSAVTMPHVPVEFVNVDIAYVPPPDDEDA